MHVIADLDLKEGGPPQACLELCHELTRLGHDVAIYAGDAGLRTSARAAGCASGQAAAHPREAEGVEIKRFRLQFAPATYAISFPLAAALKSAIPSYDVVHIHSLYLFPSTVAAYYCRLHGVPYVVRPHGTLDPYLFRRHRLRKSIYERLFERRNLERAAAVHFTSAEERDLAAPLGLRIRSVVVPLGVHLPANGSTQPTGQLRKRWPELKEKKLVLYLGRLNFKKGLDLLAGAFGEIARTRDDLRLVIAGPDNENYGGRVREWLARAGVLGKTTFAGFLAGEEKRDALAEAAMFVLPSHSENFGIAVVEAMAAAAPVVISNKVNIWREIAAAGAGLVVDCETNALARALQQLLNDPVSAKRMGERGRQLAEARFTWERVSEQMLAVYNDIVENHRMKRGVAEGDHRAAEGAD